MALCPSWIFVHFLTELSIPCRTIRALELESWCGAKLRVSPGGLAWWWPGELRGRDRHHMACAGSSGLVMASSLRCVWLWERYGDVTAKLNSTYQCRIFLRLPIDLFTGWIMCGVWMWFACRCLLTNWIPSQPSPSSLISLLTPSWLPTAEPYSRPWR